MYNIVRIDSSRVEHLIVPNIRDGIAAELENIIQNLNGLDQALAYFTAISLTKRL
jgi:hypothetical protein